MLSTLALDPITLTRRSDLGGQKLRLAPEVLSLVHNGFGDRRFGLECITLLFQAHPNNPRDKKLEKRT